MKKLLIFFLFISAYASAQTPVQVTQPQWFLKYIKEGPYTTATLPAATLCAGCLVYNSDSSKYEYSNGVVWSSLGSGGNLVLQYLVFDATMRGSPSYNGTVPVSTGVDTGLIATQWDLKTITNSDSSSITYIVDSTICDSSSAVVANRFYLVCSSPSGKLAGHRNQIVQWIGGVVNYQIPLNQQQLIVDNPTSYSTYTYYSSDSSWHQTSILWRVGGNTNLGSQAWIGRIDNKPLIIKIKSKEVARFNVDSTLQMTKFKGITSNNYSKWDSATGKLTYSTFVPEIVYVDSVSNNAGGDSLIVFKNGVRRAYAYPSGGGSETLQQAFDASVTAGDFPQISIDGDTQQSQFRLILSSAIHNQISFLGISRNFSRIVSTDNDNGTSSDFTSHADGSLSFGSSINKFTFEAIDYAFPTSQGTAGQVLGIDSVVSSKAFLSWQTPSGSSVNIYNSDGSLTGDRSVDLAGHTLNFQQSGAYTRFDNTGTFSYYNNDPYFLLDGTSRRFQIGDYTNDWYGTYIDINDDVSQKYILLKAANGVNINGAYTLPVADGTSGQVITTNGSGGLSWNTVVGSTNLNIGSGYRLAVPGTNNIKTLFAGYGLINDSTSNTNGITAKADSATLSNYYVRHKDSSVAGGYYPYSTNPKGYLTAETGTVQSVASADGSITVTNPTTTVDLAVVKAPKWTTGRTLSISGDLAYTSPSIDGSGNVTAAGTLATVNSNVGTFGDATHVGTFTVNGKGLVTAASSTAISGFASSALTNTHIFVGNGSNIATDVAASGDLTLANTGAFTFNTVNSNVGSFTNANITVNAKGLITAATNGSSGGSPAGSNGYAQFNNSGSFGADSNFFWENSGKYLGIGTAHPLHPLHIIADNPGSSPLEQVVIQNPNHSGTKTQAMIGFRAYDGSSDSTYGWVGLTSGTFSANPDQTNATYLENIGSGGVVIESDNPTLGGIKFYSGGYLSTTYKRAQIDPGGTFNVYQLLNVTGNLQTPFNITTSNGSSSVANFTNSDANSAASWQTTNSTGAKADIGVAGNTFAIPAFRNNGIVSADNSLILVANQTSGSNPILFYSGNGSELARFTSTGRLGIGTTSPVNSLDVPGTSTSISTARFGNWEPQTYSNGYGWLGMNTYYDGGNYRYRNTANAGLIDFITGEWQFAAAASGTAGNAVTFLNSSVNFKINADGSFATGASVNINPGNYTGFQFKVAGATGRVSVSAYGSGTITGTPTYALNVDASGNIIEGSIATGGTVTNVTGTTNQIDVATGTTTPVISLHSGGTLPGAWNLGTPSALTLTNAIGLPESGVTNLTSDLALKAPSASPTFTGTVVLPTPFTLGSTSVTSTGTQLNYLNAATGTTGTTSTNLVFSTSPTLVTPNLGTPSTLVLTNATGLPNTGLNNSTISGVSLGSNLFSHTASTGLTGTAYNGSAAISWTNDVLTGKAAGQTFIGGTASAENLILSSTSNSTKGYIGITNAPRATANYGSLSIGSGAFDGSTSGFFVGSANGTQIAVNAASGFTGNLLHLQKAGVDEFKVDNAGIVTANSYTNNLSAFAATTSAQLAGVISDETGSGALMFGTAPTVTTSLTMADAANIIINTTTGTKIGTGTTQKISFYNSTPIVQPTGNVITALSNLGLVASGTFAAGDIPALANLTATDATLTFSGTYNTTTARTIGLNLGNANTWTGAQTISAAPFIISGNQTAAAWTSAGIALKTIAATYTDNSSSGTVANNYVNVFGIPTLAASSTTTYTASATVDIAGAPATGTNVTQTAAVALRIEAGGMLVAAGVCAFQAGITTNNTVVGANFGANGGIASASSGAASLQFQGSSAINYRAVFNGTTSTTASASNNITNVILGPAPITEAASGTHAIAANLVILAPVITNGSATTTDATTLYIDGPPTGTATITNPVTSLWIKSGLARLDGGISITTGANSRAGDATLSSGTIAITISGLTTSSRAQVTRTVASGTTLTTGVTAVCTANTLTITADVAAGTINTADNSTYTYIVVN